jgi:hypothetical protein
VESYGHDFYCFYCDVQQNGKRKNFLPASQPTHDYLKFSTPQLMTITTVEMLFLLKFARAERSSVYGHRHTFIQAMKEGVGEEFKEGEQYMFEEYEYWTRKCFVLENLIRERIGYIPKKLTESYIQNLVGRMLESSKKDMVIQQTKPFRKIICY